MSSAQFKLDKFEGPLDLLLYLIGKHKLNIYDIEIALLLDQYLEYLDNLDHEDFEGTADFLEMASRLIYIKTCSLLPQDEEAQELKKELEGRIIEYSLCKKAAQRLREDYIGGEIFVRNPVKLPVKKTFNGQYDPIVLLNAYLGMSEKSRNSKPLKADMFEPIVSHKIVSVTSKIIFILKKLYTIGEFDMDRLYDGITGKSERVATFLAVLELTKSGRIFLNDDNSRIFMNKDSKRHKITSDFDREDAPKEEMAREEIPETVDNVMEFEETEVQYEAEEEAYEPKPDYNAHSVKKHSYIPEKVRAVECLAVLEEPAKEEIEQTESLDFEKTEDHAMQEALETQQNILEELELLAGLSKEPPETVFKPNYIGFLRYYWGNSPVGDDSQGNYWKYGNKKL